MEQSTRGKQPRLSIWMHKSLSVTGTWYWEILIYQTGTRYLLPGQSFSLNWYLVSVLDNYCILKLLLVPVLNNFRILKLVLVPIFYNFRVLKLVLVPVLNNYCILQLVPDTGFSLNCSCYQYQNVSSQLYF